MFWTKRSPTKGSPTKKSPTKGSPTKRSPNSQYNQFLTRHNTNWSKGVLSPLKKGTLHAFNSALNFSYAGLAALSAFTRLTFKAFQYAGKSSVEMRYKSALKALGNATDAERLNAEKRVGDLRDMLHKSHNEKRDYLLSEINKYALKLPPEEHDAFTKLATEKINEQYKKAMNGVADMKGGRRSRRLRR